VRTAEVADFSHDRFWPILLQKSAIGMAIRVHLPKRCFLGRPRWGGVALAGGR